MRIPTAKIRDVIGPGGKMIRSIVERTQVKIDVEDDGTVSIASSDEESARKAMQIIEELTAVAEMGKTYLGKVQRIVDFGAFVEILPGTDGLLHISEIADYRVADVHKELSEGDQVLVKVINIDPQGKVKLSRKAVLKEQAGGSPDGSPQGERLQESRGSGEGSEAREGRGGSRDRNDRGGRAGSGGRRR
jgi:polyribonucleotide nucleotidyltransferase